MYFCTDKIINPENYQTMSTINLAYERFINSMILTGDRTGSYQYAYPGTSELSAQSGASRLLANSYIRGKTKQALMQADEEVMEECRKIHKGRIADMTEKRELLAKIMRGELGTEKEVLRDGEVVVLKTTHMRERLRAIEKDIQLESSWHGRHLKYLE